MKKVIRHTKKAIKVLTEFNLKNGKKLRIYVYFWGDEEYAKKLGFYGNTIYKPVLIDRNGFGKTIYKHNKGLPTLEELKRFYDDWNERLISRTDAKRLREVADALYELARISISFDKRQAHVVYQLLRIAKGGPTFRISKPSDAYDLNVRIVPTIVVSFKGYECFKQLTPYICGTKFFDTLKILRKYNDQIETVVEELRHDLANLAGLGGPIINLDSLADDINEEMVKVFEKESR